MRRLYGILMVAAMVLVPTAATALAEGPPEEAASQTAAPAPATAPVAPAPVATPAPAAETAPAPEPTPAPQPALKQGASLSAPPVPAEKGGGVTARPKQTPQAESDKGSGKSPEEEPEDNGGGTATAPPSAFSIPSIPSSTCASGGVPPALAPIYQRASDAYGLGPQGPSVLAGINLVETAFGTNTNVSSAGAIGWMQFMPETWESYGVDANGDGTRDPYDPEDAIFAAASYLSAAGMPADTYGAIYSYNHADWYVAEVLSNAECFAADGRRGRHSLQSRAEARSPRMRRGEVLAQADPAGVPRSLRVRRRPLRPRRARGLGAGLGRPPRVRLRPRDEQAGNGNQRARSGSTAPSGRASQSTVTATAGSATRTPPTRRRRWRG